MADPEKSVSLSERFDETFNDFENLMNCDDSINSAESQKKIDITTKNLEELTKSVSAVDMFSRNENYKEMDPRQLKFLLLPYMLGKLWQICTSEERRQVCEISQVYFKDFLVRVRDYEFLEKEDDIRIPENPTEKPSKQNKLSPEDRRNRKIQKLKEIKELDIRIKTLRNWMNQEGDADESTIRDVYTSLILKAINTVEGELDSIASEMELITFAEKRAQDESKGNVEPAPPPRKPLKTFIITKDAVQKQVYGVGYPSLPVMTVEELYAQRRATGEWGPPPGPNAGHTVPQNDEEEEARQLEALTEADDEGNIERLRAKDEYMDDHRRGWGNRFNRS